MNDLCFAIKSNDIATVNKLLADGSVDINAHIADLDNGTFLMLAADRGHVEIVARLLDAGTFIDDFNDFGDSACHVAVREGRTAVAKLLVARHANVALRNRNNHTPIDVAIFVKNKRLVMLLIDAAIAVGTPLDDETSGLAATVSTDVIRLLLFKHRINLSGIRDNAGRTPLHHAVWRESDSSVIDMLIGVAGVDVDARDMNDRTAAIMACRSYKSSLLVSLIAAGADLDLADDNGNTPLHYTLLDSNYENSALLLAAGANVHVRNIRGRTVCHVVSGSSHALLAALMAFGANLDEPDIWGITPRQLLQSAPPTTAEIELAHGSVLTVQLLLVRNRAFEVCVALQSLGIDALCMCEILLHSCGPVAPFVPFHRWWRIATAIKHFR